MAALKTLLENLDVTVVRGTTELDVPDVVYDSSKNYKGMFVYLYRRRQFLTATAQRRRQWQKGAAVLVTQKEVDIPADAQVTVLKVENYPVCHGFLFPPHGSGILPAG